MTSVDIFINFVKIFLESSRFELIQKSFVKRDVERKIFSLGDSYCRDILYSIRKVEDENNIYELLENSDTIKVTDKKNRNITFIDKSTKFQAQDMSKIAFYGEGMMKKLFGLDEVEGRLRRLLHINSNRSICLYGPDGCGKRSLVKNMEMEFEERQFLWLDNEKLVEDKDYFFDFFEEVRNYSCAVVVCYEPDVAYMKENKLFRTFLRLTLRNIMEDKLLFVKFIAITTDATIFDGCIRRMTQVLVGSLSGVDRGRHLRHLIEDKVGQGQPLEDGLDAFGESCRGFTARDLYRFVDHVWLCGRNLSLERLSQCKKDPRFVPEHLLVGTVDVEPTRWCDIGGYENVKQQLREEVEFPIKHGREVVRGVLLHGPPGCSKTMFARALATECGVNMYDIGPASVMRCYVGESEAMFRQIIDRAIGSAPSILFIDEIDTLLPDRCSSHQSAVGNRMLAELMMFLNGVGSKDRKPVVLVAATNRIDLLDQALLRPGRIDLKIEVGLPDQVSRESIVRLTLADPDYTCAPDVLDNVSHIARLLDNKSGAQIVATVNSIKRLAEYSRHISIDMVHEILPSDVLDRLSNMTI